MPGQALKKHWSSIALGLKLAITVGMLGYLMAQVDIAPVLAQIRAMAPIAAVAGAMLLLVQLLLISVRWQLVNRIVDAPMRPGQVLRLTMIGHFFNQVLPSGFAGDAVRVWLAAREGVPLGRVLRGILCDRVIGLLALVMFAAGTLFVLPEVTTDRLPGQAGFRMIGVVALGGVAALFLWGAPVARLLMRRRFTVALGELLLDMRRVVYSGATSASIMVLAAAVQLLNVAAIHVCAKGMSIDLDFGAAMIIVPLVMLVVMAPVSFAGWGVREGAMIVGLGLLGITAADALAVSVAFGLLQIVLGVPGGAMWLARRTAPASGPA